MGQIVGQSANEHLPKLGVYLVSAVERSLPELLESIESVVVELSLRDCLRLRGRCSIHHALIFVNEPPRPCLKIVLLLLVPPVLFTSHPERVVFVPRVVMGLRFTLCFFALLKSCRCLATLSWVVSSNGLSARDGLRWHLT